MCSTITSDSHSPNPVLRMLSNYVGEERFLEGVSIYLKKKLYGNSVTNDLWEGIQAATGLHLKISFTFFPKTHILPRY
jgi:aminopeptidase 2